MKLVILDENNNKISSEDLNDSHQYVPTKKVQDVGSIRYSNFFLKLKQEVSIFLPYNNGDDFVIKYLPPLLLKKYGLESNDLIEGCLLSETLKFSPFISKIIHNVYDTGESKTCSLLYYDDNDQLEKYHIYDFIKDFDTVLILINDLSEEKKSEIRENDLFDNSIFGMITIKDGIFKRVNKSYCEISGYSKNEIIGKTVYFNNPEFPYSEEEIKERIKKIQKRELLIDNFEYSFYHKYNGKKLNLTISSYPILYNGESSIQCIIQDITNRKQTEKEALQLQDHLIDIQKISGFALSYAEDNIFKWTPQVYDIIERNPKEVDKYINLAYEFILPEDKHILNEAYAKLSPNNPGLPITFRIKTAKGNIKYINYYIKFTYENNTIIKRTTLMQDITEQHMREIEFKKLSEERLTLLMEVHDRVKNNLQIILSLIELDSRFKDYSKTITNDIRSRIVAMAMVHEQIYLSESFSDIDVEKYIKHFTKSLLSFYESNINFNYELEKINLNMDLAISIGLIINELVKNSILFAFPDGKEGNVFIKLFSIDDKISLIVEDDGVGLPQDFDMEKNPGLGLTVVNMLMYQINGKLTLLDKEGTSFRIDFDK